MSTPSKIAGLIGCAILWLLLVSASICLFIVTCLKHQWEGMLFAIALHQAIDWVER
jgi:hypothetical protein